MGHIFLENFLHKEGNGAVNQQQSHDGVGDFGILGEKHFENGTEQGPEQREGKADEGQQQGEENQYVPLAVVMRQYVGLHGHDAVNVNFGVDELQNQAGDEAAVASILLDDGGAFEGLPGEVENVGGADEQHGRFDDGDERGQSVAEKGTHQHDEGKADPNAQIEGESFLKALAAGIGHGHNIIGAGRDCRDDGVREKLNPTKHIDLLL